MTTVRYVVSTLPGYIRCTDGTLVIFTPPADDNPDDGSAGVREPRRPRSPAPAGAAVATVTALVLAVLLHATPAAAHPGNPAVGDCRAGTYHVHNGPVRVIYVTDAVSTPTATGRRVHWGRRLSGNTVSKWRLDCTAQLRRVDRNSR